MGITAGAHRLWAHRSYKANYKMRLILAIANLISFQNCIFDWVIKIYNDDDDIHSKKQKPFPPPKL